MSEPVDRMAAALQARLSWPQAEACARDLGPYVAELVAQARADERERAQSALEWLLIYRTQAIRGGHGPLAAEPEWITEAAGADA